MNAKQIQEDARQHEILLEKTRSIIERKPIRSEPRIKDIGRSQVDSANTRAMRRDDIERIADTDRRTPHGRMRDGFGFASGVDCESPYHPDAASDSKNFVRRKGTS